MDLKRPSSVAGQFYPLDAHELYAKVDSLMQEDNNVGKVRALIVPHSGYDNAGEVYGSAYSTLKGASVDEVFLLGPSHYSKFDMTALSKYQQWEIPTGEVEQSHRITQIVGSDDNDAKDILRFDNEKHRSEHSIEVQLPFLHYLYKESVRIIPILVGNVSPRLLASSLAKHIDKDDLVVVSAELSHGYPMDYGEILDETALKAIEEMDTDKIMSEKFRSSLPQGVATVVELAKKHGWSPKILKYVNSAQVDGKEEKTSGYMAVAFVE